MSLNYFLRTGIWGEIGCFRSVEGTVFHRGQRVVCQTPRGLEIGEVVSTSEQESTGKILRRMSTQDEMLQGRLGKYKQNAVEQCREELSHRESDSVLLDVEHLFDGRTLYFHFLGPVETEVEAMTQRLAQEYEKNVRTSDLAQLLTDGCGPGCGTSEKGCSGGCSVCVLSSGCKTGNSS